MDGHDHAAWKNAYYPYIPFADAPGPSQMTQAQTVPNSVQPVQPSAPDPNLSSTFPSTSNFQPYHRLPQPLTQEYSHQPQLEFESSPYGNNEISPPYHEQPREKPRRRSVSDSKRAAQNRSAQKAFRQRRDKYVKDLEATVARMPALEQTVEGLEKTVEDLRLENVQLRNYIMALQGRSSDSGSMPSFGRSL